MTLAYLPDTVSIGTAQTSGGAVAVMWVVTSVVRQVVVVELPVPGHGAVPSHHLPAVGVRVQVEAVGGGGLVFPQGAVLAVLALCL